MARREDNLVGCDEDRMRGGVIDACFVKCCAGLGVLQEEVNSWVGPKNLVEAVVICLEADEIREGGGFKVNLCQESFVTSHWDDE